MDEMKFETVSEFAESMAKKNNYNMNILPYTLLACDSKFINKDYLKEKIKKLCCPEHDGEVAVSDDVRKILKLLE